MNAPRVLLYDTLLRDGSQMEGIAFSLEDKVAIAHRLDQIGVHYVEGGFPGSNEKDRLFFQEIKKAPLKHAKVVAFGGTRRAGMNVEDDPNIQAIAAADTAVVTLVGKASRYQVRVALETSDEENLAMIADSVTHFRSLGREVGFDAEHFFDGFREDPDYALQTLSTAARAGAETLILCDTNGGTITPQLVQAVDAAKAAVPDVELGIHVHDDTGLAVANSLAAVTAGVVQVQGCFNGYGERCGNANLATIIADLQLKMGIPVVSEEQLAHLTELSRYVAELANLPLDPQAPFVGASAFAHKAGYHVAAVVKDEDTYQHAKPALVGNDRRVLVSELSGQRNISYKLAERGLDFPPHCGRNQGPARPRQAHGGPRLPVRRRRRLLRAPRPPHPARLHPRPSSSRISSSSNAAAIPDQKMMGAPAAPTATPRATKPPNRMKCSPRPWPRWWSAASASRPPPRATAPSTRWTAPSARACARPTPRSTACTCSTTRSASWTPPPAPKPR